MYLGSTPGFEDHISDRERHTVSNSYYRGVQVYVKKNSKHPEIHENALNPMGRCPCLSMGTLCINLKKTTLS